MPPKKRTNPIEKANLPKIPVTDYNNTRIRRRAASSNKTQIPKQPKLVATSSSSDDDSDSDSSSALLSSKISNKKANDFQQQQKQSSEISPHLLPFAIFVNGCQCEVQNPFGRIIPDQLFGPYILLKNISTNCILLPNGIDGSIQVEKNGEYVTVRFEGSNLVEAPIRGGWSNSRNNNDDGDGQPPQKVGGAARKSNKNKKMHLDGDGGFVEDQFLVPFAPEVQRIDDGDVDETDDDEDDQGENKDKKQKAMLLASRKQQKLKNTSSTDLLVPELTIQAAVYDAEKFAFEQSILVGNGHRQSDEEKGEKVVVADDKNKGNKRFEQQLADFVDAEKRSSLQQRKQ